MWNVFVVGQNAAAVERITAEEGSYVCSLAGWKEDLKREKDYCAREAEDITPRSEVRLTSFLGRFKCKYLGRQKPCVINDWCEQRQIQCKGYFKRGGQSFSRHVLG